MAKSKLVKIGSLVPRKIIKHFDKSLLYHSDVLIDKKLYAFCITLDDNINSPISFLLPYDTFVELKVQKPKGGVKK